MKQYVYEFELYPSEKFWIVSPQGLTGGTEGYTKEEAIDLAADWLHTKIESLLESKKEIPKPIFGSELKHKNSERLVVSVSL